MKKAISLLLILAVALSFVFAADPTTIKLNGNIPEGYGSTDDNTPGGSEEVGTDSGLTIVASVTYDDGQVDFTNSDNKPSNVGNKTVNLTGAADGQGIRKLTIHYGAYGNVSASSTPSVDITVSCPGWIPANGDAAVDTLTLSMETTGAIQTVFKGTAGTPSTTGGVSNSIKFEKNADAGGVVAASSLEAVGSTAVTWGVVDGKTPQAGDYSATITITVTGDGGGGAEV